MSMSTKQFQTGLSTELFLASYFSDQGYEVYWPLKTQSRCDFLISKNDKFVKIQAKTATWSKTGGHKYLQCRISLSNKKSVPKYVLGDCDLVVIKDNSRIWIIPFDEIKDLTSICLDSTNPKYKPQTKYDAKKWLVKE